MAEDHTTVIETAPRERSSGAGWAIAAILVVALVIGFVMFNRSSGSESAKDNAIANAASQVGDAAEKAGNAAQDAANSSN